MQFVLQTSGRHYSLQSIFYSPARFIRIGQFPRLHVDSPPTDYCSQPVRGWLVSSRYLRTIDDDSPDRSRYSTKSVSCCFGTFRPWETANYSTRDLLFSRTWSVIYDPLTIIESLVDVSLHSQFAIFLSCSSPGSRSDSCSQRSWSSFVFV